MKNKFNLDFKDNPDLAKAFAEVRPGDKVSLEIELQVDSIDENGMVGSIESITAEGEDEVETSPANPIAMTVMSPPSMGADMPPMMAMAPEQGPEPGYA